MKSKPTTPNRENNCPTDSADAIDLDAILREIGESGPQRTRTWLLCTTIVLLASLPYMSYVFTAGQLDYRCAVPQCETLHEDDDVTSAVVDFAGVAWLHNAMPVTEDGRPARCERYRWVGENGADANASDNVYVKCGAASFNRSQVERCDRLVYAGDEVTIVKEVCIYYTDIAYVCD